MGRQASSSEPAPSSPGVSSANAVGWRACDLFSFDDTAAALQGADVAFYLVHSMLPSARLTQGSFRDFDLICADNFARAAARHHVRQIIYLGGILPGASASHRPLSAHLASRLEVEHTLAAHGVPVTALRAALVIGQGGSSFDMLVKLVERLPAMVCPAWTLTRTQPLALSDAIALLSFCIDRPDTFGRVFDVAGPEILSYREMMVRTAARLGVRRHLFSLPFLSPRLSSLWVSLVTGAPRALVRPLVESLRHEMIAGDRALNELAGIPGLSFDQALDEAFGQVDAGAGANVEVSASVPPQRSARIRPPSIAPRSERARPGAASTGRSVRSVQRLPLPKAHTSESVAQEYLTWLPRRLAPFLRVEVGPEAAHPRVCGIYLRGVSRPLLELVFGSDVTGRERTALSIVGGLLVRASKRGCLEFREVLERRFVLAAIHEFQPRLPWPVYVTTQALIHLLVMRAFARHLSHLHSS
jgi:uncharacterized protein YbjT (DUF2867 family)